MGENLDSSVHEETPIKESPQLVGLLKEMKVGLDAVRSKVQALTVKVRENHFPTADGISYLEAKHLLLLSYCQSTVYYLLRKAKGLSIEGHPVVRSLVEIRLFLEKIRPIDKKLQYQVQKLTRFAGNAVESVSTDGRKSSASQETEDLLKYRPNPDMLANKLVLWVGKKGENRMKNNIAIQPTELIHRYQKPRSSQSGGLSIAMSSFILLLNLFHNEKVLHGPHNSKNQ